jgi:ribosome-associated toxin RatA of RatAB toxin-antitoxin module
VADRASSSITVQATPAAVMAVIADFEAYPEWTSQVKTVEVLGRDDAGRADRVRFVIDAGIVKDEYTLAYDWSTPDQLSWHLVKGQMQKAQDGTYALTAAGDATEVRYDLTVDLAIPMIGLFKRKAEKTIIDTALKGLKVRVEQG